MDVRAAAERTLAEAKSNATAAFESPSSSSSSSEAASHASAHRIFDTATALRNASASVYMMGERVTSVLQLKLKPHEYPGRFKHAKNPSKHSFFYLLRFSHNSN
jgi:hypothetical protein